MKIYSNNDDRPPLDMSNPLNQLADFWEKENRMLKNAGRPSDGQKRFEQFWMTWDLAEKWAAKKAAKDKLTTPPKT